MFVCLFCFVIDLCGLVFGLGFWFVVFSWIMLVLFVIITNVLGLGLVYG